MLPVDPPSNVITVDGEAEEEEGGEVEGVGMEAEEGNEEGKDVGREEVEEERVPRGVTPVGRTGSDGVEEDRVCSVLGGPSRKKASMTCLYVSIGQIRK